MEIAYKLENGPDLFFKSNMLSGNINLFINNVKQNKTSEKGKPWKVIAFDGSVKTISIRNNFYFYYEPKILIDGNEVLIDRKLSLWEIIISSLPLLLMFIGGAMGALFGFISFVININIFRNNNSMILKIVYSIASSCAAVVGFFIAVLFIKSLIS